MEDSQPTTSGTSQQHANFENEEIDYADNITDFYSSLFNFHALPPLMRYCMYKRGRTFAIYNNLNTYQVNLTFRNVTDKNCETLNHIFTIFANHRSNELRIQNTIWFTREWLLMIYTPDHTLLHIKFTGPNKINHLISFLINASMYYRNEDDEDALPWLKKYLLDYLENMYEDSGKNVGNNTFFGTLANMKDIILVCNLVTKNNSMTTTTRDEFLTELQSVDKNRKFSNVVQPDIIMENEQQILTDDNLLDTLHLYKRYGAQHDDLIRDITTINTEDLANESLDDFIQEQEYSNLDELENIREKYGKGRAIIARLYRRKQALVDRGL